MDFNAKHTNDPIMDKLPLVSVAPERDLFPEIMKQYQLEKEQEADPTFRWVVAAGILLVLSLNFLAFTTYKPEIKAETEETFSLKTNNQLYQ